MKSKNPLELVTSSVGTKAFLLFTFLISLSALIFGSNYILTQKTIDLLKRGTDKTFPTLQKLDTSIGLLEDYQLKMGDGVGQSEEDYLDEAEEISNTIVANLQEVSKLDDGRSAEMLKIAGEFSEFATNSNKWAKNILENDLKFDMEDPATKKYFVTINTTKEAFANLRDGVKKQYLDDLKKSEDSASLTISVGLLILGLSIVGSNLAFYYTRKFVIRPIRQMAKSSLAVIEGRYESAPPVDLKDEVGQLNGNFNSMVTHLEATTRNLAQSNAELARKQEEILALNHSLEDKVAEQTRDIRSMLENTKIGLMSVTRENRIHKDYARYLETMLEQKSIADEPVEALLLSRSTLGPDAIAAAMTAIDYSLGEDELNFEANFHALPKSLEMDFDGRTKYLDLDWSPVLDADSNVEKILVSMRDVTETLRLRREAEEGRQSLKLLGELLEIGPKKFAKIDTALVESLADIEKILGNLATPGEMNEKEIRELYIILHTIKGAVRMQRLSALVDSIHQAEETVSGVSKVSGEAFTTFKACLVETRKRHAAYIEAYKPISTLMKELNQVTSQVSANPLVEIFQEMESVADQLAKDIGKAGCAMKVDLASPPEVSPDFVKALSGAVLHLVRNSVDHGIESPDERLARSKPAIGNMRVFIDEKGRLGFGDDGRGLNLKRIKEKAQEKGLNVDVGNSAKVAELIFDPGFSTKDTASDISGRGVGMDAVRSLLRSVGSDIEIVPLKEEKDHLECYFAINLSA